MATIYVAREMTIVVEGDRWEALLRRLAPLLLKLEPWVDQWLDEEAQALVDERRLNALVVLGERFPTLVARVTWVILRFEDASGAEVPRCLFEPIVALAALPVAARRAAAGAGVQRSEREVVGPPFLKLWNDRADDRTPEITAPHVAAAYLSGIWAPDGYPRFEGRWEPARLQLGAIVYKMVHHGAHALANMGLAPWTRERQEERARFDARIMAADQRVASWLVCGDNPLGCKGASLTAWDWEQRTLWEFLHGVVLGPGRAGEAGNWHLTAGAFRSSLFGCWAELAVGTTVGTVEVFVCPRCPPARDLPGCATCPETLTIATARRHRFVAPRDRLEDADRELGYVRVERKVCKNPPCLCALAELVGWADPAPIYPMHLQVCPYCHTRVAGQRPVTVWTKRP